MKEKLEKIEKKRLLLAGGFLLLIIIILFGGAFVYNKFFYKRSYSEIEKIMLDASKEYFATRPNKLPKELNETITISDKDLVNSNNMNNIEEYLKDENSNCTGSVNVTNINGKYRYTSLLDCGDSYQTKTLIDYINKNVSITTQNDGLYNLNDELVYRGENVNNYIKFSSNTYRIVKITNNQEIVIIYTEKSDSAIWDDRYNVEKDSNVGINNYSISRIKDQLQTLYEETNLISEENKLLVASHSIGIGKRTNTDTDKTGNLENSVTLENQYIGLLQMNDYLNASTDINCVNTISPSCENYNYLAKYRYSWWTTTASAKNSYQVYKINKTALASNANNSIHIRPVLYLTKDTIYVSGNGSKESPYIVK